MLVYDFNGKTHKINLALYIKEKSNASSLHKTAREVLKSIFPLTPILEEVPLPGTKMFADFLIPSQSLIIEVQGEQHYKFNSFHFDNKLDFAKAKTRDRKKKEWAEINNLQLIELRYDEDIDGWTKRIADRNN